MGKIVEHLADKQGGTSIANTQTNPKENYNEIISGEVVSE